MSTPSSKFGRGTGLSYGPGGRKAGAAVLTYVDTAHVARAIFVGAGAAGGALVLLDKLISGSASDDK